MLAFLARVSGGMIAFWLMVCTTNRSNFCAMASSICCACRAGSNGLEKVVTFMPAAVAVSAMLFDSAPRYLSWVGPTNSAMRFPSAAALAVALNTKAPSSARPRRIPRMTSSRFACSCTKNSPPSYDENFYGRSPTMRYGSTRAACLASPQSRLHHQRIDVVAEPAHVVDVARPVEQRAVEADLLQAQQAVDDLLLGPDQRIAAPAGDEMLLHLGQHRGGKRLGIGDHGLDQVGHRLPVALLVDVFVEIGVRLLLGVALLLVGVGPHLDVAAVFLARQVAVGIDLGLAIVEVVRAEHDIDQVAVLGREVLALVGAARIHDGRKRSLDRLRFQIALLDPVEAAFEVEFLVLAPQPL